MATVTLPTHTHHVDGIVSSVYLVISILVSAPFGNMGGEEDRYVFQVEMEHYEKMW